MPRPHSLAMSKSSRFAELDCAHSVEVSRPLASVATTSKRDAAWRIWINVVIFFSGFWFGQRLFPYSLEMIIEISFEEVKRLEKNNSVLLLALVMGFYLESPDWPGC